MDIIFLDTNVFWAKTFILQEKNLSDLKASFIKMFWGWIFGFRKDLIRDFWNSCFTTEVNSCHTIVSHWCNFGFSVRWDTKGVAHIFWFWKNWAEKLKQAFFWASFQLDWSPSLQTMTCEREEESHFSKIFCQKALSVIYFEFFINSSSDCGKILIAWTWLRFFRTKMKIETKLFFKKELQLAYSGYFV